MDTKTAGARCLVFAFLSRVLGLNCGGVELGPRASSAGAEDHFRSITEACRETDRSGRSKVSLKAMIVGFCRLMLDFVAICKHFTHPAFFKEIKS